MAQNRKPPAYQEYASAILANRIFRQLSLASRGLLWTMRLECWENMSVPSQPYFLARTLGYQQDELVEALTSEVKSFFKEQDGVFVCPELEDYRNHLEERRKAQSAGGKKGASVTNSVKKSSTLQGSHQDTSESLVKSKPKKSKSASIEGGAIRDEQWVEDYESYVNEDMRH